jgi:hypothetical protein
MGIMKKHIVLPAFIFLSFFLISASAPSADEALILKKIGKHYKSNFFTSGSSNPNLLRIYKIKKPFIGKLYVVIDFSSVEQRRMVYFYSEGFLYPVYNFKTYNSFIRTSAFYVSRHNVMAYFKVFLKLQNFYSGSRVYTEIDKKALIKKYSKYGKKGFKKRLESYYIDEPDIKSIQGKPLFYISLPTFTSIGNGIYFRLRTTKALIKETGVIDKIWGAKQLYFIYNGEIARISPYQLGRFEKNIY